MTHTNGKLNTDDIYVVFMGISLTQNILYIQLSLILFVIGCC